MQFQFDANQDFQLQAIEAIAALFEGQMRLLGGLEFKGGTVNLAAVANRLDLDEATLLANLRKVQESQGLRPDADLKCIKEALDTAEGVQPGRFYNFSVEMETGTGKTYVYLRTILELFSRYGMRKFIIVAPSIAIRQGVLKTLAITHDHFAQLYGNLVYRYYSYDSANLTLVRQFALSDAIEIMVMTIDSFNKAENVIRQTRDQLQGETPIHLVQAARPVLVLDEPQNMESELSRKSLALLNPLFALRYSATHRNPYNLAYRLTPAEAYRRGLVKRIELASVVRTDDANRPYIKVLGITTKKRTVTAKLAVHKLMKNGTVKEKPVTVRFDYALDKLTGRKDYAGYEVDEINPLGQFVRFKNNLELKVGDETGADKTEIFRAQIRETVQEHLARQARLRPKNIKVLSLFFIDRVSNYLGDGALIRRLFYEAFDEFKTAYPEFRDKEARQVQAAYFAQKKRKGGVVETLDSVEGRDSKEDETAYALIMNDKERLLSFDEPVCFIFSHSALREGWDNPNIFQICTLNQVSSITRKRQEIGRGVRLAVDTGGQRHFDEQINILTVVANESYKRYVESYQSEISADCRAAIEARYGKALSELTAAERAEIEKELGQVLPPPPREAGKPRARLNKARALSAEFKELWARIKHKTRYSVEMDMDRVMDDARAEIERLPLSKPRVELVKAQVKIGVGNIFEALQLSGAKTMVDLAGKYPMPNLVDLLADLMEKTTPPVRLTRQVLASLYVRLQSQTAVLDNPFEWASNAVRVLKEKLADQLVSGIEYEKTGDEWAMQLLLDQEEVELFSRFIVSVDDDQALYDQIACDSQVEERFVKALEARQDVKFYLKLPNWFTVPTPVGEYRPDWAIVMEGPETEGRPALYLVSETKDFQKLTELEKKLRPNELRKIKCGAAHFGSRQYGRKGALTGVDFKVVSDAGQLP